MSDEPTWGPGDLDKLFENIMTNPHYAMFEPVALSRPPAGPWVVTFSNMILESESAALTATVQDKVRACYHYSRERGLKREQG